ncbi:MAG: DUF4124 domain-containing protein [Vicinamibacteria bacterium]|jgi:hypothetical protein
MTRIPATTMRDLATLAVAAALALAVASASAQKQAQPPQQQLYKWTDEKGNVHYSDKAPDSRGGVVLDKQGRQVRTIEAPPTPEQARVREAEAERQKVLAKEQEGAARRDRALLASYTTESEIDLARARASATYETQIQSAQAYLAQLTKRKQDIDTRKARFGDKPIPPQLESESASVNNEYAKNSDLVAQKRRELAAVVARYESDKARWRELRSIETANTAPQAAGRPPTPVAGAPKK